MKTDWDAYYSNPYKTAKYSREIIQKIIINLISKFGNTSNNELCLAEFGGANSCFFDKIQEAIKPKRYIIVDNNEIGLKKLEEKTVNLNSVAIHCKNILSLEMKEVFDLTFSVGLIEHFSVEDTKRMIQKHFEATKKGGRVIISFPTPTFLYKITRFFAEKLGLWIFHDERPLLPKEVIDTINETGTILYRKTIWPIFLTQHIIVATKD